MRTVLILTILCVGLAAFAPQASAATVNLKDFGAVGDGQTDDGPSLQQALDALANAGGGTLFVPAGRYAIITPVHKNFSGLAASITILGVESSTLVNNNSEDPGVLVDGLQLVSEFAPMTGETGNALSISGLQHFLIKDIGFIGTPDVTTDAVITLALDEIEDAIIRHCEFYGLISRPTGGAIVHANRSRLAIESTKFLGCTGNSSANVPVIQNLRWKSIKVTNSTFVDYGGRPELFSKTGLGTPYAWVNVGSAEVATNSSLRREVVLDDVFFDEAALVGILVTPMPFQPPNAPIDLVYITGLRMNVTNASDWWGNYVWKANAVFIEKSRYGWSQHADAAVNLFTVGTAILDQLECVDGANRIRADATTDRLSVINSTYTYLDSLAPTTEVINTDSVADDPVQYVRQQFETVLQRAPDPAGHFYWSDRILRCGPNATCAAAVRVDLDTYLNSNPAPTFSITGRVIDPESNPMSAQTVSLSGSQTAVAQTDVDGRYSFSGLPTSGIYTVTTTREHFTFIEPSVTITTPAGDQTADFAAVLNQYSISGQIVDESSQAIPNITVTLTGAMSATTTTNSEGYFSFQNLPALGGYTVTPAHKHHDFQPSFWTITELTAEYSGEIVGIRKTHAIQGQVLRSDGSAIAGVLVNLSGSDAPATTTDSTGNYVFSALPAGSNYVITPSKPNYSFTPPTRVVNDLSADESSDFSGSLVNYTLSGRITDGEDGLSGVTVNLSGSQNDIATTDDGGNYAFNVTAEGNYTVTPSRTHYSFDPANMSLSNLSANETMDFAAALNRHDVSGRVTKADGTGLWGAILTLSGSETATASTNTNGNYSFAGLPAGGTYMVAVSHGNYSFDVQTNAWNDLGANSVANFTGELVDHQVGGIVTLNGVALPGVTITISGSQAALIAPDLDGAYSIMLPAEGSYVITPTRANYTFDPVSATIDNHSASSVLDFEATINPGVPVLISEANSTRALAFDSVLHMREPFKLNYSYPWTADRRTRLMIFAQNFELTPNETVTAVTARAEASNNRNYPLTVEYVGKVPGSEWLTCIVVRLWDGMDDVGDVLVSVTYRNITSNRVRIGIGHIGGGPADDPYSMATPGRAPE